MHTLEEILLSENGESIKDVANKIRDYYRKKINNLERYGTDGDLLGETEVLRCINE